MSDAELTPEEEAMFQQLAASVEAEIAEEEAAGPTSMYVFDGSGFELNPLLDGPEKVQLHDLFTAGAELLVGLLRAGHGVALGLVPDTSLFAEPTREAAEAQYAGFAEDRAADIEAAAGAFRKDRLSAADAATLMRGANLVRIGLANQMSRLANSKDDTTLGLVMEHLFAEATTGSEEADRTLHELITAGAAFQAATFVVGDLCEYDFLF